MVSEYYFRYKTLGVLSMSMDEKPNRPRNNPWGGEPPQNQKPNQRPNPFGGQKPSHNHSPELDDFLKKAGGNFKQMLPSDTPPTKVAVLAILALVALWLASGFYFVQPNENGVVLSFGKYMRTDETPGLKYIMPWPFQSVTIVDVTSERRIQIGFQDSVSQSPSSSLGASTSTQITDESLMLTGDENIIDINFVVLWRISDARNYLFSLRDQEETLRLVSSSAMREIIGNTKIQSALTDGRSKIQSDARALMQKILDEYKAGVTVNNVQLQKVDPPEAVVDAFNEVQRARQEAEREKNLAEAYRNSILPVARGEAAKLRQEAEAYKQEVMNRANGDAARFDSVLSSYREGPTVTSQRMYLETIENVLSNARTVVIGSGSGSNILPYLPLDSVPRNPKAAKPLDSAQEAVNATNLDNATTAREVSPPQ
jgi:membrane protease subunit HflK